ncbi:helix-turn-helix transcriptional regulator [Xenorhabdus sp. Vera]|uniref:helix-turn-helix domain-containing protein n=1 Tax=Xenorhabdus koppenhoeferi TaxID=351659 RepID=UPI0019B9D018|nr:helix-turn-helix transcriptional regulator [Xenorhabdus sp. Vera]MBD2811387.1 helix-turn-helix transcriptional regulator [Xenorhabdus sp. Vera]
MKISVGEKLLLMRESERLKSRPEAAEMLGIPTNALWRYETGKTMPDVDIVTKILSHPRFEKYALWFVTGKTVPEIGQIAPALYDPKNYENGEEKSA